MLQRNPCLYCCSPYTKKRPDTLSKSDDDYIQLTAYAYELAEGSPMPTAEALRFKVLGIALVQFDGCYEGPLTPRTQDITCQSHAKRKRSLAGFFYLRVLQAARFSDLVQGIESRTIGGPALKATQNCVASCMNRSLADGTLASQKLVEWRGMYPTCFNLPMPSTMLRIVWPFSVFIASSRFQTRCINIRDRWPQGLDIRANHIAWLQRCDNAILDDVPMEADVEAGRLRVDTFLVLADQIRKWAPVLLASAADQDEERVLLGSHIDLLERAAASLEPEEWAEHAWRTGYEYCIISNMKAVEAVVRGGNIDLCDLGGFRAVYYVYNCC